MNLYITGENGRWHFVEEGPFATKTELRAAVMEMIGLCVDYESTLMLSSCYATASKKRIGRGKNIRGDWITAKNRLSESKDEEIKNKISALCEQHGIDNETDW